jgi:hypothetical protein
MHISIRQALIVGALTAFPGCGSNSNPAAPPPPNNNQPPSTPTVTSVSVTGGSSVTVGQTVQLSATANLSNSTTQDVSSTATWSSSNTGSASISNTGLATGVAPGTSEIRAAFQGVTGTVQLQVNAAAVVPPVARFTVSGPGGNNVCRIMVGSSGDLDCTFDGSASTGGSGGSVAQWTWRYDVGANSRLPITENDPIHNANPGCGFFVNRPPQQGSNTFIQMIVKLVVRNAAGVESAEERNSDVRLFPQNQCGFGF